jgi:hypothetical protein
MLLSNMFRHWIQPIQPVLPPIKPPRPIVKPDFLEKIQQARYEQMFETIGIWTAITVGLVIAVGITIYCIRKKKGNDNNVRN